MARYARRDQGHDLLNENDIAPASLPTRFGAIVRLLILTGQRRGAIVGLQKSWIKDGSPTVPANITKNGREHTFPLGTLSLKLLQAFTATTGILFPGKSFSLFNG
jgi:integrase